MLKTFFPDDYFCNFALLVTAIWLLTKLSVANTKLVWRKGGNVYLPCSWASTESGI